MEQVGRVHQHECKKYVPKKITDKDTLRKEIRPTGNIPSTHTKIIYRFIKRETDTNARIIGVLRFSMRYINFIQEF